MKQIAIFVPSHDWGFIVSSAVCQHIRRAYRNSQIFIVDSPWGDDLASSCLPSKPIFISCQEAFSQKFDQIMCLSDSVSHMRMSAHLDGHGIYCDKNNILVTDNKFAAYLDSLNTCRSSIFASLSQCFESDELIFPNFFPDFEPKMHDRQGVAIKNSSLRCFVKTEARPDGRLWHVPIRKSMARRIEECRRVSALVTDDPVCAWSCASGGGKSILLKDKSLTTPNFSCPNMVEEEIVSYANANTS